MRHDFVEARRGRGPARLMRRALRAPPGGYYGWRGRPADAKAEGRAAPVVAIKAIHGGAEARSGGPRIHAELRARGQVCRVDTAARLMRGHGIAAEARRKSRRTADSDHDRPVAAGVVGRGLEPGAVDRAWTADVASISTGEGRLYPAAVGGLDSREVVGRSMGPRIDSRRVVDALEMAPAARRPGTGPVAHADRGRRYAGGHYQGLPARQGVVCGMSRRANRWANAPMASFFARPKEGRARGETFATRGPAGSSLFEYVGISYNRVRRHSSLGYLSPAEYERAG